MGVATTRPSITDQDLLRLPRDGRKYELVDGEIRVGPAGMRHGEISLWLGAAMLAFVSPRRLGRVFDSSTRYRLPGGNVRSPDASFVSSNRLPRVPEGFAELAPDLAVELLSPEDKPREVLDKVGEYLAAGVRLVWVIDPRASRAVRYRSLSDVREIGPDGTLDGEDLLPGFHCPLAELLG
ncbi:MAG TPA: Uma2 family endonuclease [Vicinamibacteria bacterium]|jgi:Uma2 family endonuclease|nr:Uma2 family endonuclease [Vicinamibacteria bacterium]